MKANNISIAQMQVIAGQPEKNLRNIIRQIKQADSEMIIFPEMAVPGYFIGDEWENESFVKECNDMNQEIIDATKNRRAAIWWNILVDKIAKNEDWTMRKYNAWFIAQNWQKISNWIFDWYTIKSLMPKYKQFDDERYFYSLEKLAREDWRKLEDYFKPFQVLIDWVKKNIWIVVCEDMWDADYQTKPIDILKNNKADIIVNISASPFALNKQAKREKIMSKKSEWIDFIYTNNTWIQNTWKNIFVFDWESSVFENWEKIWGWYFLENKTFKTFDENVNKITNQEKLHQVLTYGIKEFLKNIKQKKVVIWLSWWIDSAIVATLLVDAIWKENVIAINMPSKFNSNTTKNIAKKLAFDLGIKYIEFPIQDWVDMTKAEMEKIIWKEVKWLVFENMQARDRWARVLAWIASLENAVFTANWNKTEIALGYATLYWDVAWAFAPIWDLYKTQVYDLARYLDEKKWGILNDVINVMPSAELWENQNIEAGKWDPFNYPFVDAVLYQLIEERKDIDYILQAFYDWNLEKILKLEQKIVPEIFANKTEFVENLEKIYKLFKNNFFKRIQTPPIISISKRAFGTDLREAQNTIYFTRDYRKLKDTIIKLEKLAEIYDKFLKEDYAIAVKEKFHEIFLEDAWIWEAYSIATHTHTVITNFEKYFPEDRFPENFDREIFKLILALHDIGKPEAIANEWKDAQHEYTSHMIKEFFDEIQMDEKYKNFAVALVWVDVIWGYLQNKISLEEVKRELELRAMNSDFDRKTFIELLTIFFRCDAGAYTSWAGQFESLDHLFDFNFNNMILDFDMNVKIQINEILVN